MRNFPPHRELGLRRRTATAQARPRLHLATPGQARFLARARLRRSRWKGRGGGERLREERAPPGARVHCGKEAAASRAGGRCTSGGGGGKSSRPLTALWSRVPSSASDRGAPPAPRGFSPARPSPQRVGPAEPAGRPGSPPRPRRAGGLP